jgi:hypothetical protein
MERKERAGVKDSSFSIILTDAKTGQKVEMINNEQIKLEGKTESSKSSLSIWFK